MSKGKKHFNFKEIIIITILSIIFSTLGIISVKGYTQYYNQRSTIYIKEILDFIGKNNPINIALNERIELYKEEERQAKEIAKKLAEEKEKKKQEEIKRLAEEKKKEEAEAKEVEEETKNKLKSNNENSSKVAYLTFDDGPSKKTTEDILKILDDYDIKATFFVLGKMAKANPEVLKVIYNKGHSIGNHSYSHNYKHIYKNTENFLLDIKKADETLKDILGEDFQTRLLRLPGGSFEKYKKKYVKAAAEEEGYVSYDWNALNGDAELPKKNKDELVKRLKNTVKGKEELIVLMHDTDTKKDTVKALPEIIEYLIEQGYSFKSLEQ